MGAWLEALTKVAQGAADAFARKEQEDGPSGPSGTPGCTPCAANAYVAGLFGVGQKKPAHRKPTQPKGAPRGKR